jgi:glyoxylase-like metal-dependent hydrolase (beta-lactamase superfamily II)
MAVRDGPVNLYVVRAPDGPICIDAGWRRQQAARGFRELGLRTPDVRAVFLTHTHRDHAGCLSLFPEADVYVSTHEAHSRTVAGQRVHAVADGQVVTAAGCRVKALEVPGHTAGSLAFIVEGSMLFTGDTLSLKGGLVRPFPFCFNRNNRVLARSIRRLAAIDGLACLLTAHNGVSHDPVHAFSRWRQT